MFLFSSRLRQKLFGYVFTHAHEQFYAAELAKLIHEDTANVFRELRNLEKEGVFKTRVKGRIKLFELNNEYPLYNELRNIVSKTVGVEGLLLQIVKKYSGIKAAFIYGSYAKNKENPASDIDLLVVGKVPEDKFAGQISKLEKKISRDINFSIYSPEEFSRAVSSRGSSLSETAKAPRITLKGSPLKAFEDAMQPVSGMIEAVKKKNTQLELNMNLSNKDVPADLQPSLP